MNNKIQPRIICKKLCLIGNYNVGKTSIVHRELNGVFNDKVVSTIGASFYSDYYISDDFKIKLEMWDTAGNERYESLAPMYFRNSDIILLVYDLTDSESIKHIHKWLKIINRTIDINDLKTDIILVGNKKDLLDLLKMGNRDYNKKYIDEIHDFIEESKYINFNISCKTGYNIDNLFNKIKEILIDKHNKFGSSSYMIDTDKIISDLSKVDASTNTSISTNTGNAYKCC